MRIGFDRQTFTLQKHGGISRYFSDLYLGLREQPGIEAELLFKRHLNCYLADSNVGEKLHPIAAKLYIKAMVKGNLSVSLASEYDIHHATYYLGTPKRNQGHTKLVSTLYDMIPELFPRYFKGNPHVNKLTWFAASDQIISISDSAAADLAYFQPHLADRIRRIHLYSGFSAESAQSKPAALEDSLNRPFLLFVGSRAGYKNAGMLIRAFAASEPSRHGHQLLFAGGGALSKEEQANIALQEITSNVQQLDVSDAELWYLYLHAKAVLVPSMAEGFSLPLVEGLAANVPVICSDIPVHREVAGDFATLVNPLQHHDWADILSCIGKLKQPSDQLGEDSFQERCNYFSKRRMVEEHVKCYSDLLA